MDARSMEERTGHRSAVKGTAEPCGPASGPTPEFGRILVVRFSAIGDCVMAAWAATALRLANPMSRIDWAVSGTCAPVIDDDELVSERFVFRRELWKKTRWRPSTWRDQLQTYIGLRHRQYDVGFDFQGHSKTALALRIARPKRRIALRGTDAFARRLNPSLNEDVGGLHTVEQNMRLIREAGSFELPDRPMMPQSPLPPSILSGAVVIGTGAGHPGKIWPVERWAQVGRALVARRVPVVIAGAGGDPRPAVEGAIDAIGKLNLLELCAVVRNARLVLAADTGIGHIASAYAIPSVSVFGPTDPYVFRPYGPHARVLKQGDSPLDVSAEAFIEAAEQALEAKG